MFGDLGELGRLVLMGALWRLGERFYRVVLFIAVVRWCVLHAVGLAVIGFGLYVWATSGSAWEAGGLIVWSYALVLLARVAITARAGTARGLIAILTGHVKKLRLQRQWPRFAAIAGLKTNADGPGEIAPLGRVRITQHGLRAEVHHGAIGADLRALTKAAGSVGVQFNASRTRTEAIQGATSRSLLILDWGHHLRQVWSLSDLFLKVCVEHPPADGMVPFGIDEDGHPACFKWNLSKLLGALTRAGKSSTIWAYLAGLIWLGIPLQLWVFDPKRIEFAEMRRAKEELGANGIVREYINDLPEMTGPASHDVGGVWYRLTEEIDRRGRLVEQLGVRELTPAMLIQHGLTLIVVIVDEFLPLASDIAKWGNNHPIARIGIMGGAIGMELLLATQAGQIDATGRVRDLVPERFGLALPNVASTNAVLGDGADADGARCSELSLEHDKGVGYKTAGGDRRGFTPCRAVFVSDAETVDIARGRMPALALPGVAADRENRATILYGHQFNREWTNPEDGVTWAPGTWAYVGVTSRALQARWEEHLLNSPWAPFCDLVEFRTYAKRSWAEDAEAGAIERLRPLFNDRHNRDNPDRIDWRRRIRP